MPDSPVVVPPFLRRSLGALHASSAADDPGRDPDVDGDADADADEFLDETPAAGGREGLPTAYRMRHDPHYVETLGQPAPASHEHRGAAAPAPAPSPAVAVAPALTEALDAVGDALALLPTHGRSLRERVAIGLALAELTRARWLAEAAAALEGEALPALDEVQLASVLRAVARALDHERRLTGEGPRIELPADPQPVFGDERLLTVALGAAVVAMRGLGDPRGIQGRLVVRMAPRQETATRVIEIVQGAVRLSGDARPRFFDRTWAAHPAGSTAATLLAAARRIADAHGGSLDVEVLATGGCRLVLHVPAAG